MAHSALNEPVEMNPAGGGAKAAHGATSAPKVSLRRFDITDQRLLDTIDGADAHCSPEIMVRELSVAPLFSSLHTSVAY